MGGDYSQWPKWVMDTARRFAHGCPVKSRLGRAEPTDVWTRGHSERARAKGMHGCELLFGKEEAARVCELLTEVLGYSPCAEGKTNPLLPADAGSVLVAEPVDERMGAA